MLLEPDARGSEPRCGLEESKRCFGIPLCFGGKQECFFGNTYTSVDWEKYVYECFWGDIYTRAFGGGDILAIRVLLEPDAREPELDVTLP